MIAVRKEQEGGEKKLFVRSRIVEPLDHMPAVGFIVETADQIDPALGRRKACGLYIKKEGIRKGSLFFQKGFDHLQIIFSDIKKF